MPISNCPRSPSLAVTVYSNQPELLKPLLASTPRVTAVYRKPSEYRANDAGLVILDRFIPPQRPAADSIWIDPPAHGSPIPVRAQVSDVAVRRMGFHAIRRGAGCAPRISSWNTPRYSRPRPPMGRSDRWKPAP